MICPVSGSVTHAVTVIVIEIHYWKVCMEEGGHLHFLWMQTIFLSSEDVPCVVLSSSSSLSLSAFQKLPTALISSRVVKCWLLIRLVRYHVQLSNIIPKASLDIVHCSTFCKASTWESLIKKMCKTGEEDACVA